MAQSTALSTVASSSGPYRVHAFLEDTNGNMGCLYSGNYAAVRNEADIASSSASDHGKHPCPSSFNTGRHNAGFKTYAYNDVAMVGNGMPVSSIPSGYYFKDSKCSDVFIQPGGAINGQTKGREITNIGHYPEQLASAVNDWEDKADADYFYNDDFGNIGDEGVPTGDLCQKEWSVSSYTGGFPSFLNHLNKPQIVNLASNYDDDYNNGVVQSNAFMVASEEGLPNFKKNAMFSLSSTESKLNRLLQLQSSGKKVVFMQYNPAKKDSNGNPVIFPEGFSDMYDQRMWNYAGGWLVLDLEHFYMQTANEGNYTNSGATVEPEYYFVPQNPLKSVSTGNASSLQVGNLLVREYRNCYYKSKAIGQCAMVLNPNTGSNSIHSLSQSYGHSVVISGEGAMPALEGVDGGVSTPADTGTLSYTGPRVTSVAAGRAVILTK